MESTEDQKVFQWRFKRATALGLMQEEAFVLASSWTDLHEVERLVRDGGCEISLAIRIAWIDPPNGDRALEDAVA